jgi:hypothetical protein
LLSSFGNWFCVLRATQIAWQFHEHRVCKSLSPIGHLGDITPQSRHLRAYELRSHILNASQLSPQHQAQHTRSSRPVRQKRCDEFNVHRAFCGPRSLDGFGYGGVGTGPGRSKGVESMRERRWLSRHAHLAYRGMLMYHYAGSLANLKVSEAKVHTYIEHVDKRQWVWVGVVGA